MTNYYEYKHPVINNYLAVGSGDGDGDVGDVGDGDGTRKFQDLQEWYNVINDYEFKSRCPIILKNSHKNKHFTFACHLKGCPFKVLLSYAGNETTGSPEENEPASGGSGGFAPRPHPTVDSILAATAADVLSHSELHSLAGKQAARGTDQEQETDVNGGDANVSAAIAAAVAAVQDDEGAVASTSHVQLKRETDKGLEGKHEEHGDGGARLEDHGISFSQEDPVRGPFIVTKIEPYHNHSLEENMALDKFVLTKVPRILQHDLNFDEVLEELYRRGNNSMNKFKVSQFVEESGLLEIIKRRYHLSDDDISKKFTSLISRRVTTYKARFVLKKKKMGEYKPTTPTLGSGGGGSSTVTPSGAAGAGAAGQNSPSNLHKLSFGKSSGAVIRSLYNTQPPLSSISVAAAASALTQHLQGSDQQGTDHPRRRQSNNAHGTVLEDENGTPEGSPEEHHGHDQDSHLGEDAKDVQAAAQAAMSESTALKRGGPALPEDDLERYIKRSKHNTQSNKNQPVDEGINLDEIPDDKLPHDVAEQLRLLSSHFKEVESHGLGQVDGEDDDEDEGNDADRDSDIDILGRDEHSNSSSNGDNESITDAQQAAPGSDGTPEEDPREDGKNTSIPDENIQPELRGQ
ncbi:DNA-binding protein ABF1 KNAG_0E02510 [Huiozyma naganishii CBS 8797]|uniref:Uncharacterized protein n=1 Tax=Huiozyma naganishii (strain ATCC MYA-139 / BCRC 22969 / CBS 8797 / KCTC 17520 / NBRC 10181 / NCYC 3082 / Yp74L-3) TaxID=1071383 RepID=J7S7V3_HUIN7|nr:hypothetical protein KNAG_0E02510 [Kazachstania naganishii CBS 8797]CCK70511.1 hypothetical protein KNAG_0E02510 [Kazachstania naganishii CBS 8797]